MKRTVGFFKGLAIVFVFTSLAIVFLQYQVEKPLVNPYIWWIQFYFVVMTAGTYFLASRGIKENLLDFHNYYMGATGIRLIISVIIIFVYAYVVIDQKVTFILNFFILYLFYTGFEIKSLLSNLRAHSKSENKQWV